MMTRGARLLTGTLLGVFFSVTALAQESGAYLGAALGQSKLKNWCNTSGDPTFVQTGCDDTDVAWKLIVGYQFNRYFAVEGSYIDWGDVTLSGIAPGLGVVDVSANQQAYAISAIGSLRLGPQFSVFAKVGLAFVQQETVRIRPNPETVDRDETETHYGIGAKFHFSRNWAVRGEWEVTDKRPTEEGTLRAQMLSIGAEYRF